jgi:hypothetical protein
MESPFRSRACEGTVFHKRLRPKAHAFQYRVFSLLIALDELPRLGKTLRLFGHNRWNLLSFFDRDHGDGGPNLKDWVLAKLREHGLPADGIDVELLCYPRILGYVFNPLSVYLCRDRTAALTTIIYEVSNTFGDRHAYVIPIADRGAEVHRHGCRKALFVSPFNDVSGDYAFTLSVAADRLSLRIDQSDADGPLFVAGFSGRPAPLSNAATVKLLCRYPLMTFKVIAAIHWEALRLLLKGVPLRLGARSTLSKSEQG